MFSLHIGNYSEEKEGSVEGNSSLFRCFMTGILLSRSSYFNLVFPPRKTTFKSFFMLSLPSKIYWFASYYVLKMESYNENHNRKARTNKYWKL